MDPRRGFALAAALMILALLSVLGAAAIQSISIETRISAHDRDARTALYLAETALGEARYYASRGWGKVRRVSGTEVVVDTPLPAGLAWEANRYAGFTLYDRLGTPYPVVSHTDDVAPPILTLTVAGAPPGDGRFTLVRLVPPTAQWSDPALSVDDDPWALASPPDAWRGWTLWNANGKAFPVLGSSTGPAAAGTGLAVRLTLPAGDDPAPGPYRLSLNPWLRDLAAGATLPGDADGAEAGWNRTFRLDGGQELGTATVTAAREETGRYALTASGSVGPSRRRVAMRVTGAGLPDQRSRDWAVVGE